MAEQLPVQMYTASDVISALVSLQENYSAHITGNNEPRNIKHRILFVLASANPEGVDKEISAHDSSIMEIAGDLFHAIQNDSSWLTVSGPGSSGLNCLFSGGQYGVS